MLAEAGVTASPSRMTSDAAAAVSSERPLKRPRTGRRPDATEALTAPRPKLDHNVLAESFKPQGASKPPVEDSDGEDEDVEFEDVEIPKPTVQTTYLSSEDDTEEEEDIQFEDVDVDAIASQQERTGDGAGTLQLNLTAAQEALHPSKPNRRQPLTKAEKERRVELHRMHLLCLLAHAEKRNHWCNDPVVHQTLRSLLGAKTVQFLNPGPKLTQFGQTESLKRGLKEAQDVFKERFRITEIGMRRALWAEDKDDLLNWEAPPNIDNCLDKADFRKAARSLKGSRDVGAMLFCALLRAVGVEARLVCSLQPLSFVPGGPTLPKPRPPPTTPRPDPQSAGSDQASQISSRSSARRRLGHPFAAAYHVPDVSARSPSSARSYPAIPRISESTYPVYWAEVLDIGHQKWQPVDALVTGTHFRSHKLEPAASDRGNILTYVVAFEDDGAAKDVTRRYAKAYNSKTRRMRIDGPLVPASAEGAKWWRKALRRYKPSGPPSDLDQIEITELNAAEAREPMPRNVSDFKDHPIYALARHLRRHEVFVPGAKVVGTVGAGSKGPLEKIYRRRDVRVAHSAQKWYRMGREVLPDQESIKVLPKRKTPKRRGRWHLRSTPEAESADEDDDPVLGPDPAKGTPLYLFDQTRLYVPPPVVAGRVPKNRFGNLDVYVPTMVPAGGIHIKHPRAGHAAHILGVDYAPALQGFEFKGRTGTAVYNGVVVPFAAAEGVRAVLEGFADLEAQMEEERRSRRALETWRKWLRTLTIRRRLFEGDTYWGDTELGEVEVQQEEEDDDSTDGNDELRDGSFVLEDEGSGFEPGGFEPGGFEPIGFEPGGFEPGGFEPGGFEPDDRGPGGLNPGGFDLDGLKEGDFEPGGFEVEAYSVGKGKGKEPKRNPTNHYTSGPARTGRKSLDDADEAYTPGPGGCEIPQAPADADMEDARALPTGIPSAIEDGSPDEARGSAPRGAVPHGSERARAPLSESGSELTSAPPTPARGEVADGGDLTRPLGSRDAREGVVDLENIEIEDAGEEREDDEADGAESDVTEELFMDEDGSLIE